MKVPTDRAKFMDDLRSNLEDVFPALFQRSYLVKRNISDIIGREAYVEYTEEHAPQLLEVQRYGGSKKVKIEFCECADYLAIYVDGKYHNSLSFDACKNKTTFTATVAVWIERIIH